MPAGTYNFVVEQYANISFRMTFLQADGITPMPLTGFVFKGDIRLSASLPVVASFSFVVISEFEGILEVSLYTEDTSLFTDDSYVYDIIGELGGDVYRFLTGTISTSPGITKP